MQLGLYIIYILYKLTNSNLKNLILFCYRYVDGQDYMESVANALMKVTNTSLSLIFSFEKPLQILPLMFQF